jgi:hypothetical protein
MAPDGFGECGTSQEFEACGRDLPCKKNLGVGTIFAVSVGCGCSRNRQGNHENLGKNKRELGTYPDLSVRQVVTPGSNSSVGMCISVHETLVLRVSVSVVTGLLSSTPLNGTACKVLGSVSSYSLSLGYL